MRLLASTLLFLALSFGAAAQSQPVDTLPAPADGGAVSLRDYITTRFDQLKQLVDERDRLRDTQYAQRFEAQQKALADALQATQKSAADALQAIKETTSNTLAAAKEAVAKAENANEKRFESQNEFRQTLTDQQATFVTKAEADARQQASILQIKALEDDMSKLVSRMDEERSRGEGAGNLWFVITSVIGFLVVVITCSLAVMAFNRQRTPGKA